MKLSRLRIRKFFQYIVERQRIWYRKEVLKTDPPWTKNEVLKTYHFCNNYREADRGTLYPFGKLENVRMDLASLLFTISVYRVYNTPDFFSTHLPPGATHFNPKKYDWKDFVARMDALKGVGKNVFHSAYLTGPYSISNFRKGEKHVQYALTFKKMAEEIDTFVTDLANIEDLQDSIKILQRVFLIGPFIAYQIVLDLLMFDFFANPEWTDDDVLVVGPGAKRGLRELTNHTKSGNPKEYRRGGKLGTQECRDALAEVFTMQEEFITDITDNWKKWRYPFPIADTNPYLSLSNIEFALCEFSKYTKLSVSPEKHKKRYYRNG